MDFLVINPKNRLDEHPLVLAIPWLATEDVYIICQKGNTKIVKGIIVEKFIIYPPTIPSLPIDNHQLFPPKYHEENQYPPITLDEALTFKGKTEDGVISGFINQMSTIVNPTCQMLKKMFNDVGQEDPLNVSNNDHIPKTIVHKNIPIEIEPGKTLNINANMDEL